LTFRRLRKFVKSDHLFHPVCLTTGPFVRVEQLVPQWTDFSKIISWKFVKNMLRNFNVNEYLTILTVALHEDICSYMIMSRSTRLTINDSVKDSSENKTRMLHFVTFFKMCLYEVMFKNMTLPNKSEMSMLSLGFWWHSDRPPQYKNVQCFALYTHTHTHTYIYIYIYRVSQEECARLREGVPYVKVYRYNTKHLCSNLNCYGGNGQRNLKLWQLLHSYWLPNIY
jgi:hypothetical protein